MESIEVGNYFISIYYISHVDRTSPMRYSKDDIYIFKSHERDHGKGKEEYHWDMLFSFKENNFSEAQPQQNSTIIDIDEQFTELLSQYLHTPLLISEDNCHYLNNLRPICWMNPKPPINMIYDLVIIGGGQRSIEVAMLASTKGLKVALIEKRFLGGKYWNSVNYPLNYLSNYVKLLEKIGYPLSMESFEKG